MQGVWSELELILCCLPVLLKLLCWYLQTSELNYTKKELDYLSNFPKTVYYKLRVNR